MAGRSEFRQSQGVVPFGVGAVTDFPDDSLMMAGLDAWPTETADGPHRAQLIQATQIVDGRLARRLSANLKRRIDYFLTPTEAPDPFSFGAASSGVARAPMPFVRFPNWHFCPRCRVMKHVAWNTPQGDRRLRCTNQGRRVEGTAKTCAELFGKRQRKLAPVRFVVACEQGHISDFPWVEWAHSKHEGACSGGSGELYLYSTPSAGLAGVVVGCVKCQSKRTMAGAFQKDALRKLYGGSCPGERPWLGNESREDACPSIPQTIQRGASNAYFARVVSSILIPPYSALMQRTLDRPDVWEEILSARVDGNIPEPLIRTKAKHLGFDADTFVLAVRERLAKTEGVATDDPLREVSEEEYRRDEYRAFIGLRPPKEERHDFDKFDIAIADYGTWFSSYFERVVLVPKLRETRVLTGFSRITPPDSSDRAPASLSLQQKTWLPAFEVRGEGVMLIFSDRRMQQWMSPGARNRVLALQDRMNQHRLERRLPSRPISPALVLAHSFAHLLIRQMAFECGYDSSDLRERLYASSDPEASMRGLLIYTASGDSEGTLGGLVRQGEPGRLDRTVKAAIETAYMCSSDPLCIESEGQGTKSLNLAACHACALLPENSCEEGNLLLDRGLIIGTPDDPALGFFEEA